MGEGGEEMPSSEAKSKEFFPRKGSPWRCFQVGVSLRAKVSGKGEGALGNVLIPEESRGMRIFPYFLL